MNSWFERHPRLTLLILLSLLGFGALCALEYTARSFGLGTVVVYHSHPIYGYRLNANQKVQRFNQALIAVNNLGLRANSDWNRDPNHKVLFLGDSVTYGGSYISNDQLFSKLAVEGTHWQAGNAGVNGWGVLNIHALIKELEFLPAERYITVIPEGDFYRGLNRIGGQPFWTRQPGYALEELFYYGLYKLSLRKTPGFEKSTLSDHDRARVIALAARSLKELDTYLKAKGFAHQLYITPSRTQVVQGKGVNEDIKAALEKHQVSAIYLLDKINTLEGDKSQFFHDEIHLTAAGHAQWAVWIKEDFLIF